MSAQTEYKDELQPIKQALNLEGADILDLGCGIGSMARRIAKETGAANVTAIDAEAGQIARAIEKGGGVKYLTGVAEALPLADASLDAVIMMKSLHHVPIEHMDAAFSELSRCLRSGGEVYICEPAYEGPFNDILRIFHDEGVVRAAALKALERAVGLYFEISQEFDYQLVMRYSDLDVFRKQMMYLPWLENRITPEIEQRVATEWQAHADGDGSAVLPSRMLVFVLRKL